jgi:CheY-like chemotaxis protein
MSRALSILLVDDDRKLVRVLTSILEIQGHRVTAVYSGNAALEALNKSSYDVVLADLRMPRMDGLQMLRTVGLSKQRPKIIIMTAYATPETQSKAKDFGAFEYLEKPFKLAQLRQALDRATA